MGPHLYRSGIARSLVRSDTQRVETMHATLSRPRANAAGSTRARSDALCAEVESFYHLAHGEHTGKACQGTACFAARHFNPTRWAEASAQKPRVYCLGECF